MRHLFNSEAVLARGGGDARGIDVLGVVAEGVQ